MTEKPPASRPPSIAAWRRAAEKLFDQQLWSFGYDIRRPEGNVLIAMGCTRIAAPAASECSSCYQVDLATGQRLTLRGFGMLCEDLIGPHAIFLHRDSFRVSWFTSKPTKLPWRADDLPSGDGTTPGANQHAASLMQQTARWIADYEQGVAQRLGASYRKLSLEDRGKRIAVDPAEMSRRWRQIASDSARWPSLIGGSRPRRKPKRRRAGKTLSPR